MKQDPMQSMAELLRQDRRYKLDAYIFVFESLNYGQNVLGLGRDCPSEPVGTGEEDDEEGPQRHVTGQQLCEAVRQYALEQYGYMARTVLNSWGIHTTGDVGEIVFNLIRVGRMRKTKDDTREDFEDVFDLNASLSSEFKFTSLP